MNESFAQSIYVITIPEGASNPENSFFWSVRSTGNNQGQITITKGESIMWENNDSVDHAVTSGSPKTGSDGIFDSGLFGPGKTFTKEFPIAGEYPYFCSVHPWMIGKIFVAEPYLGREQAIQNVGKEFDINEKGVEVKYTLEGTLSNSVNIDTERKSVTFYYDPLKSKEDVLIIKLPEKLIYDVQFAEVNGEIVSDAIRENIDDVTTMYVPLWPDSKEVTFIGTKVVSGQSLQGGGCLIATAAYGSELAPQVQQLRELRNNIFLLTPAGSSFIDGFNKIYYLFSPTLADLERENPMFKEAIKLAITPMISSLSILNYLDLDSELEVFGYGAILIMMNIGMYIIAPVVTIREIKKRI